MIFYSGQHTESTTLPRRFGQLGAQKFWKRSPTKLLVYMLKRSTCCTYSVNVRLKWINRMTHVLSAWLSTTTSVWEPSLIRTAYLAYVPRNARDNKHLQWVTHNAFLSFLFLFSVQTIPSHEQKNKNTLAPRSYMYPTFHGLEDL